VNENSLRNLNQPSEVKARAARTKKGMEYYVTRVKKTFIQSPDLLRSLKAAAKRQRVLLEKSVSDDDNGRLSEDEVKELAVINNFLKPYLDKTVATKFESDNKHEIEGKIQIFTVKPTADDE